MFSLDKEYFVSQEDNFYVDNIDTKETPNLLRKYFYKWHSQIKNTNGISEINRTQKIKINDFIVSLKNHQKDLSFDKRCENTLGLRPIENFKNRYKVQNDIIDLQKEKIKKQNKIIGELKLGIIRDDILHSAKNNKNIIREIFGNCSEKVFYEAPLLKPMEDREKIMINAQKVPKFVQEMQDRAIQREKYREEILKRKRVKEEEQQKLFKEIMEKKKFLEEEEIKRNLDIINEQRKQELKLQKLRLKKIQQIELKMLMASNFYNRSLINQCFKKLFNFYKKSRENIFLATTVFVHKEKLRIFKSWVGYVEAKYSIKFNIADTHFRFKSLKRSLAAWKEIKLECVRSLHVAEDFYDLRTTINTFVHWHRYVCKQIMIEHGKYQIAIKHSNRRLLFQYFHQWRYLPTIIQLEKSKEETKRKWREKVWQILPDYRPPEPL